MAYFSIRTKSDSTVEEILSHNSNIEFIGINVLQDLLETNSPIFIVLGGDRPDWETGLIGMGIVSQPPYEIGYEGRNFKIKVDIKFLLPHAIKRENLIPFRDTYGIIGIGPITKWEPNQALSQIADDNAIALMRAILELYPDVYNNLHSLVGDDTFKKILEPTKKMFQYASPYGEDENTAVLNYLQTLSSNRNSEKQHPEKISGKPLPSSVRECAKALIDAIYNVDKFNRIKDLFELKETACSINTKSFGGNFLPSVFHLPNAAAYTPSERDTIRRTFQDEYYSLGLSEATNLCKLSTQWYGTIPDDGKRADNILSVLIDIINTHYSEILQITGSPGNYSLCSLSNISKKFIYDGISVHFHNTVTKCFITSLLAKPFVILTGNSGTGKTRIARQFAEYLEVLDENNESNWLLVPVGADWTDNTKILGFYNPIANSGIGKYEKTEILKLIERANNNPSIPFFLILDEMNLSHVERYFSDFLSHMEIPSVPFKLDGYIWEEAGSIISEGVLQYPDNLFIVGTVNIDETTYMFSPKVLDRANVIEFRPEKNDILNLFDSPGILEDVPRATPGTAEAFLKLAKRVRNGETTLPPDGPESQYSAVMRDTFGNLYDIVEKQGFEFAYRTVREIRQYVCAAYALCENGKGFDLDLSIDEQVLQKILPKIHGNRKEIGEMLKNLLAFCRPASGRQLELSASKIEQMIKKLDTMQYASFI